MCPCVVEIIVAHCISQSSDRRIVAGLVDLDGTTPHTRATGSLYDLASVKPLIEDLVSYQAVVAGETLIGVLLCRRGCAGPRYDGRTPNCRGDGNGSAA